MTLSCFVFLGKIDKIMKHLEQYQTTEASKILGGTETSELFTNGSRQFPTPRTITIVP